MTREKATYNGWSNYETWTVYLWLTNDAGNDRYWTGRAAEILGDPSSDPLDTPAARLADEIREAVSDTRSG